MHSCSYNSSSNFSSCFKCRKDHLYDLVKSLDHIRLVFIQHPGRWRKVYLPGNEYGPQEKSHWCFCKPLTPTTDIDGFEWGTTTDGTQTLSVVQPPLTQYGGQDGPAQMQHFKNNGFNTFRLAVGWAYLTNGVATGTLNAANLAKFDELVTACLNTGAYCIIDLHTYARFNGAIIGQGGPTNDQFAAIWTSLANHYLSKSKIIFSLMNEPHDGECLVINPVFPIVFVFVVILTSRYLIQSPVSLPGLARSKQP